MLIQDKRASCSSYFKVNADILKLSDKIKAIRNRQIIIHKSESSTDAVFWKEIS